MQLYRYIMAILLFYLFSSVMGASIVDAKLHYFKLKIEDEKSSCSDKENYIDSIIHILKLQNRPYEIFDYSMKKAALYAQTGDYVKAYNIYKKELNIKDLRLKNKQAYDSLKTECLFGVVEMATYIGLYDEGIAMLYDIITLNEQKNPSNLVKAYSKLGALYMLMEKMGISQNYADKAIRLVRSDTTLSGQAIYSVYNNYAGLFFKKAEYDSTLYYLLKAERYIDKLDDKQRKINLHYNLAITYEGMGKRKIAREYFQKALIIDVENDFSYTKSMILLSLGDLYSKEKKFKMALKYYNEALDVSQKAGVYMVKSSILVNLSALFYAQGEFKKAYDFLLNGRRLGDSVFNAKNAEKIILLKEDFDFKRSTIERELLEEKIKVSKLNDSNKNIWLAFSVLCISVFIVIILYAVRKIRRQNSIRNRLEDKIYERNNALRSLENEYSERFETKNRELTSHTLFLIKTTELLNNLKSRIKETSGLDNKNQLSVISSEIETLLNSCNVERSWEGFKLYFEQVHQCFFTNLERMHPDLTKGEQRLCALLIMNLSNKEIADISNRTPHSIETLTWRLRKKLGVSADIKTVNYLKEFLKDPQEEKAFL